MAATEIGLRFHLAMEKPPRPIGSNFSQVDLRDWAPQGIQPLNGIPRHVSGSGAAASGPSNDTMIEQTISGILPKVGMPTAARGLAMAQLWSFVSTRPNLVTGRDKGG
jgi:hypothetical protein